MIELENETDSKKSVNFRGPKGWKIIPVENDTTRYAPSQTPNMNVILTEQTNSKYGRQEGQMIHRRSNVSKMEKKRKKSPATEQKLRKLLDTI